MDASIDELVDHDEIDLQIAKLQAQIRALALKRNSTSPSIRIPPELLQQIFLVHRQIVMLDCCREFSEERHRSERPTSTLYNPYVPWLAPSQVSTNWRAVALACGSLWNEFLFTSIPWTKEFMARSRDAPLRVVFPTAPSDFGEYQLMLKCLVLVCRQPERVESLDLIPINYNCRNKETQADLRTLGQLIRPEFFPSLRRVSLKTLPPWNIGEGPPPPDFASSFLQAISTNNTSGLVSLIIEGIPPSTWGTRYFPTLTNLSLHDCPSVSVPEIHHLVEALPHLTHLTVANCCTQAGTETPKTILASEQRITLPKLELLYLNLPLLALSAILKTLDFPLSAIHSFAPTSPYRIEPYNSGYTDSGDRSRGEAPFTADFQAFLPVISSRMHSRFQRRDLGMAKTMFANLSRDHFQLALGAHSSIEITKKMIPSYFSEVEVTSDAFFDVITPLWDEKFSAHRPEPLHAFDAMLWEQAEKAWPQVENVICCISSIHRLSGGSYAPNWTTIPKPSTKRLIHDLANLPNVRRLEVSGCAFEKKRYRANVIAFLEILRDEVSFPSLETLVLTNFWLKKQIGRSAPSQAQNDAGILQGSPPTDLHNESHARYQNASQVLIQHSPIIPQTAPSDLALAAASAISTPPQTMATLAHDATHTIPAQPRTPTQPALFHVDCEGYPSCRWEGDSLGVEVYQQQPAAHPMPNLAHILGERIIGGLGPHYLVLAGVGKVDAELVEELKGIEGLQLDVTLGDAENESKKHRSKRDYDGLGWRHSPGGYESDGYA